jgi:immune inhibitor A
MCSATSWTAAGFDFSVYDSNKDGYLDGVMAFHSGTPAELGPADCAADYMQRIWSQAARGPDPEGWVSSDGLYTLDGFTVSGGLTRPLCTDDGTNQRLYTPTNMAICSHELGHTWQLEDYYDQTPGETGIAGVGSFEIMCQAYGWNYDGNRPGYFSTYNKMLSGWLEPVEITQDGFYAIQPIELSGLAYKISGPFPDGEYLLIESRYPYRWNDDWPTKGIAIYHVDENAPLQTQKGYPGRAGFPAQHYKLAGTRVHWCRKWAALQAHSPTSHMLLFYS